MNVMCINSLELFSSRKYLVGCEPKVCHKLCEVCGMYNIKIELF